MLLGGDDSSEQQQLMQTSMTSKASSSSLRRAVYESHGAGTAESEPLEDMTFDDDFEARSPPLGGGQAAAQQLDDAAADSGAHDISGRNAVCLFCTPPLLPVLFPFALPTAFSPQLRALLSG